MESAIEKQSKAEYISSNNPDLAMMVNVSLNFASRGRGSKARSFSYLKRWP